MRLQEVSLAGAEHFLDYTAFVFVSVMTNYPPNSSEKGYYLSLYIKSNKSTLIDH